MTPTAVKRLRSRLKLSQAELAEKLRVNQSTVHRWENGERVIPGPAVIVLEQMIAESVGAE